MINIGMCDDNIESIKSTSKLIEAELTEQNVDAEVKILTNNQKEVFDAIYNKKIDILFLDIDFKNNGKNGIEFAKDLRAINKDFYLIFLSAHQRYMHISFFVKVFDYLIKPINREIIEELVNRINSEFMCNKNIFLHVSKWMSIRVDDILYIEKIGNKCKIVCSTYEEYTTKTLESLLKDLPSKFRKCHRSFIVNEDKILSVNKKDNFVLLPKSIKCPINSHFFI